MHTHNPAFVLLSFEGPDPYACAGGLGVRVSGLARALAEEGYETHLFFVGAPELPDRESDCGGRLFLHRWCQWISRYHPGGVYDGEEGKLNDWTHSLPRWLEENLLPGLIAAHGSVVVIGEEWHTSWSVVSLARRARTRGCAEHLRFFWNANNTFGFDRVPWSDLRESVTVATVSRFMKHEMWRFGVDALVIPNGIAAQWLEPCARGALNALKRSTGGRLLLTKIARWDPDKRWLMAVDAVCELKRRGLRPLLIARGGIEAHGAEVAARVRILGLSTTHATCDNDSAVALSKVVETTCGSDIVFLQRPLSRPQLQLLYRASHSVLANSGVEPFGLVGLEAMASGGVSLVGATGEDYATSGLNAISLQTNNPDELVSHVIYLREHPAMARRIRREARRTATRFTWQQVIRTHIEPAAFGRSYANRPRQAVV